MKTEIKTFTVGGATARAEKPGKRRNIMRWRENRRRRLAYIKQPTEFQLARAEPLDRQLECEVAERMKLRHAELVTSANLRLLDKSAGVIGVVSSALLDRCLISRDGI